MGCHCLVCGQCSFKVTVPPAITTCSQEPTVIDASVDGQLLFFKWSPESLVDNPFSLHPMLQNPTSQTLRIEAVGYDPDDNLIKNGDFELGDTLFSSQYESNSTKPGGYIIGRVGTELFEEAKPCDDHTSGMGLMMMAKISDTENVDIWCMEVPVKSNTDYRFEAVATGLRTNFPPIIVLKINGQPISSGTLGSFACSWQDVNGNWSSTSSSTAEICLSVSMEDIGAQTDFALDDLGFFEVCQSMDETQIEVIPFEIETAMDTFLLPCQDSITLAVDIESTIGQIDYTWNSDDVIIDTLLNSSSIVVYQPGTYRVEATLTESNLSCNLALEIPVVEVGEAMITVNTPDTINCQNPTTLLTFTLDQADNSYVFEWTNQDGQSIPADSLDRVFVDAPGIYNLTIEELSSGCTSYSSVAVFESKIKGIEYDITQPDCINENGGIVIHSVEGGKEPYLYSIDGGINYSTSPSFLLDSGMYEIQVKDIDDCLYIETIEITPRVKYDIDLPASIVVSNSSPFEMPITTNIPESSIIDISWMPTFGLSCDDCLVPIVSIDNNITYIVEIMDQTGCLYTSEIEFTIENEKPYFAPNAFSPNNDGIHDNFVIFANTELIREISNLTVTDRFGNTMFENSSFLPSCELCGWNGTIDQRQASPGIYIYVAEITYHDGQKEWISGDVLLLR